MVSATRWPLKAAVVGLGSWGVEHARAWSSLPGVELIAVCEQDESRLRDVARDFAGAAAYASAKTLARQVDLDVVSIVTHEADRLAVTPLPRAGVTPRWRSHGPVGRGGDEDPRRGAAHGVYAMPGTFSVSTRVSWP